MVSKAKLAIIGAGAMGSAIAKGIIQGNNALFKAEELILFDLNTEKLAALKSEYGFQTANSLKELQQLTQSTQVTNDLKSSLEQIIIAVKPKDISELIQGLGDIDPNCTIISVAAGIKIASFEASLPENPIIRVMPNTPCQIAEGATVLSPNSKVDDKSLEKARQIFASLGLALVLDESQLDAVTALSGSGPAYIFLMIESMIAAAVKLGLDPDAAKQLATQTVIGAAKLVASSNEDPASLREKVTSPNGTTHAALESFKASNFPEIVATAIQAAQKRSKELAS